VELGYARVSSAKPDLDRQIEALVDAGVARERIYVDKKSGATVDRPGLRAVGNVEAQQAPSPDTAV
jgi:DNA invertase Pin-like site-specific DNA recombinase